jgi:hypothetical protein
MTCECLQPDPQPILNDFCQIVGAHCGRCDRQMSRSPGERSYCTRCYRTIRLRRVGLCFYKACCGQLFPLDARSVIALLPVKDR